MTLNNSSLFVIITVVGYTFALIMSVY